MFILHPSAKIRMAQAKIAPEAPQFTHGQAVRVKQHVLSKESARKIVVDLGNADDAETSAFAELILLRRSLLRSGRVLVLTGLRDRAAGVYQVNRLTDVLPQG